MLKKKDFLLLTHLRHNARDRLTVLSKKTRMPISTIHDKLKSKLKGILDRPTMLMNFAKLGFNTRAYIILKVGKTNKSEVREFLERQVNVNTLHKINNGYDYMLEGIFKHVSDLEMFMEKIDELFDIKDKKVYYIIQDIQRENFMQYPEHLEVLKPENFFT